MPVQASTQPAPSYHQDGGRVTSAGATFWFTGLPSAGKTTIATALAARLSGLGAAATKAVDDFAR